MCAQELAKSGRWRLLPDPRSRSVKASGVCVAGRGKAAHLADALLQEAGDSLMMKPGEAANRLSRPGVLAPEGVE